MPKIRGSSGAEFSGSCAIGDEELQEISGQVPESFTYDLKGKPLKCEISSKAICRSNSTSVMTAPCSESAEAP